MPDSFTVCGLLFALSLTVRVPVAAPFTFGVNVMLILQPVLLPSMVVQVVVATANGPVIEYEMPVSVLGRLFLRVTVLAAVVVPTFVVGKFKTAGKSVVCSSPLPDSGTVCGLPGALSAMLTEPVIEPTTVGENVTVTLQVLPAVSVVPQVLAEIANGEAVVKLLKSSIALPLFTFLITNDRVPVVSIA